MDNKNKKSIPLSVFVIVVVSIIAIAAAVVIVILNKNQTDTPDNSSHIVQKNTTQSTMDEIELSLEIEREKTDLSNIRTAYGEIYAEFLLNDNAELTIEVESKQKHEGWQKNPVPEINGYYFDASTTGYIVGMKVLDNGDATIVVNSIDP